MNKKDILGKRIELTTNVIYKDKDVKNLLRVFRAESVTQLSLLSYLIHFEIMIKDFYVVDIRRVFKFSTWMNDE